MASTKMCSVFEIASLALVIISCVTATKVNTCDNGNLPDVVTIEGCDSTPCTFILDKDISLSLNFTSPTYLENIAPSILATVAGITVPFPIGNDACDGIVNTSCPLEEGEIVTYAFSILLSSTFVPETSVGLVFSILNKDGEDNTPVVCFQLDVQTKKA